MQIRTFLFLTNSLKHFYYLKYFILFNELIEYNIWKMGDVQTLRYKITTQNMKLYCSKRKHNSDFDLIQKIKTHNLETIIMIFKIYWYLKLIAKLHVY